MTTQRAHPKPAAAGSTDTATGGVQLVDFKAVAAGKAADKKAAAYKSTSDAFKAMLQRNALTHKPKPVVNYADQKEFDAKIKSIKSMLAIMRTMPAIKNVPTAEEVDNKVSALWNDVASSKKVPPKWQELFELTFNAEYLPELNAALATINVAKPATQLSNPAKA